MTANDYVTDEAELLHQCRDLLKEIRDLLKRALADDDAQSRRPDGEPCHCSELPGEHYHGWAPGTETPEQATERRLRAIEANLVNVWERLNDGNSEHR